MNQIINNEMLGYNTQQNTLVLPEYGRNVQQMIDFCVSIADKEERTRCAYSIIQTMGNLFPHLRDIEDFKHKLWDHLAIMSGFKLDIDFPYDVIKAENLYTKPEIVDYQLSSIKMRHYGKTIELMIERAAEYPEGEEKDVLISLLAHHMKKLIFSINKDGVEDEKIFNDLCFYSRGRIKLDPANYKLRVIKDVVAPPAMPRKQQQQQRKKNK